MGRNSRKGDGKFISFILLTFIAIASIFNCPPAAATITTLKAIDTQPIGLITSYYQETGQPLSQKQALSQYQHGQFHRTLQQVLTFGIGAPPVWIGFSIDNQQQLLQHRRFVIDKSWLDDIKVFVKNRQTGAIKQYHVGDTMPFSQRANKTRTFQLDFNLEPGINDVMLHVTTADSMVLPLYLLTPQQQTDRDTLSQYSYGMLYGYLLALLLYNAVLFIGLRDIRYLLYSTLLASFVIGNIAYTGHGFMWLWPELVTFQLWGQSLFMVLFSVIGLLFTLYFLNIKSKSSFLFRFVASIISIAIIAYVVTILTDQRTLATLIAFIFVSSYMLIALLLGAYALKHREPNAPYFIVAVTLGSVGVGITALAAWGLLPFNQITFHAAEIGMLTEATLLALALSFHFKTIQAQRLHAQKMAHIDPLTQLNNRRGFFTKLDNIWGGICRNHRPASVIIFDLDSFKNLNDNYGHEIGDQALKSVAQRLMLHIRSSDIAARWGGEEFVLFLPETDIEEAYQLAERFRQDTEQSLIQTDDKIISFTASFGIAEKTADCETIEKLIANADHALFAAKKAGKNCVYIFDTPTTLHEVELTG